VLDNGPCHYEQNESGRSGRAPRSGWSIWLAKYAPQLNKKRTRMALPSSGMPAGTWPGPAQAFADAILDGSVGSVVNGLMILVDHVPEWFPLRPRHPPTGRSCWPAERRRGFLSAALPSQELTRNT